MQQFALFFARAKEIQDWLTKELGTLRSSRATPAILDSVLVESYGTKMPVKHVASISLEDPKTLRVTPFEISLSKEIEKAITAANLGLSVSADESGVRARFPELTSERRQGLVKIAGEKTEHARINLRKLRDEAMRDFDEKEKKGVIGRDEKFRTKKELEKLVEGENQKLQDAFDRKQKEFEG